MRADRWRAVALSLAVLLVLVVAGTVAATGAPRRQKGVVAPSSLVTYAAVIRLTDAGIWKYIVDGSHVRAGFTEIACNPSTGDLTLGYTPVSTVASAWVNDDETLARRGIIAGPSVGLDHMVVRFTQVAGIKGPLAISCMDPVLGGGTANFWVGLVAVP